MREEYNRVLSTPIEADIISRFGWYRYIGKTQISADISVDLYLEQHCVYSEFIAAIPPYTFAWLYYSWYRHQA